jgi:hypothetical protein
MNYSTFCTVLRLYGLFRFSQGVSLVNGKDTARRSYNDAAMAMHKWLVQYSLRNNRRQSKSCRNLHTGQDKNRA